MFFFRGCLGLNAQRRGKQNRVDKWLQDSVVLLWSALVAPLLVASIATIIIHSCFRCISEKFWGSFMEVTFLGLHCCCSVDSKRSLFIIWHVYRQLAHLVQNLGLGPPLLLEWFSKNTRLVAIWSSLASSRKKQLSNSARPLPLQLPLLLLQRLLLLLLSHHPRRILLSSQPGLLAFNPLTTLL